jgi:hypothetical protein
LYKDDTWFADYKRIRVIAIKFWSSSLILLTGILGSRSWLTW